MIFLLLGAASLVLLLYALGAFSKAEVSSLRQFGLWTLTIGGLLLTVMLIIMGRGGLGFAALVLLGPMVWSWAIEDRRKRPGGERTWRRRPGRAASGGMTREEAFEILGLEPGASVAEIKAAHHRLMRASHPDAGGSDWLAARINQARDVLLR